MRIHRLLAGLLSFATLSSAAWRTSRDAPDGWSGTYSLVTSDSTDRMLTAQSFALPSGAQPQIKVLLVGPDSARYPVAFSSRSFAWSGTNIHQVHLRLNQSQRALKNLPRWKVQLDVSWNRAPSGSALLPIVANTIANPKGAAFFGSPRALARKSASPLARLPSGPALTVEIGDASKRDDKMVSRTNDHGIFRLTGKDLKKLFGSLAGSSLRNISVYRSSRDTLPRIAGGEIVPPTLQAMRIERISSNLDGPIQDEDEVRFMVEGASVWVRDTSRACGSGWKLSVNPYALSRRYLVALQPDGQSQPASVEISPAAPAVSTSPSYPIQTWAVEKHQLLANWEVGHNNQIVDDASGTNWFWFKTSFTNELATGLTPNGLVSDSGCVEVDFAAMNSFYDANLKNLKVNGTPASPIEERGLRSFWSTTSLQSTPTTVSLDSISELHFLGLSIHALQQPELVAGQAEFPTPKIGPLAVPVRSPSSLGSDSVIAYALVDGQIVRRVPLTRNPSADVTGWAAWILSDNATTLDTRYRVGTVSSMLSSASSYASLKTWTPPTGSLAMADFGKESGDSMLVITTDAFSEMAQEYAQYRTSQSPKRKLKTRFVRIEDIYLLYSGGAADPTALRDFLRWSRSSQGTSHALLLGSGYYDMRDLLKTGNPTVVPTWETGNFATDNYFAYLDSAEWSEPTKRQLDLHIGRIPASTPAQISAWFAKLKTYESPLSGQDPSWRNTAMLVADDFYVNDGAPFTPDGAGNHARQSEELYQNLVNARPWLGFSKVFLDKYEFDANYNKPMARLDIISRVNQGVMLFNYLGHGAGNKLSHETVFDLGTINALSNASAPFLFFAGACAVGRFDAGDAPLGVSLITASGRGAVATISATRATYSTPNGILNLGFFNSVFDTVPGARSLGEVLTSARNNVISTEDPNYSTFSDVTNQDAYVLLGDPAMPLANVGLRLSLDSFPDTLQALYAFKKGGTVSSPNPTSLAFRIQGIAMSDTLKGDPAHPMYEKPTAVTLEPKQILSLTNVARNGQLVVEGMTPAKLEFGKTGSISAFAIDQTTGACGGYFQGNILQYGTDTSSSSDDIGPAITFTPCDSSYSAGEPFVGTAKVPMPFCLQVNLADNTGISSATGPDEGTFVNLPGVWNTYHPTMKSGTSFRQASFQLNIDSTKFAAGSSHQLSVLSHDQMGNFSRGTLQIQVQNEDVVGLYDVFNRPNPVKNGSSTTFFFKVTATPDTNNAIPSSLQAAVRIHTLSGKLIRVLHTDITQEKALRPKAVWDLKDAFGNQVANGLYPYTVLLRVPGATVGSWEQYEKRGIVAISR